MSVSLAPTFGIGYQAFTIGGLPLNAGLLNTYIAGGVIPQATFTSSSGLVQNANPIVLGADGRPPNEIWLTDGLSYRFDLTDSLNGLIKSYDNISGGISSSALAASSGSSLVGFIQSGTGATARTVQDKERDIVSVKDFGAKGDGVTDDTAAIVAAKDSGAKCIWVPHGNYLHTAISWDKPVSLVGESAAGSIFTYTPTTGTAWTVTGITQAQADAGQVGSYGFYNIGMTGSGSGHATTVIIPNSFDFDMVGVVAGSFGTGITWGTNSTDVAFQTYERCQFLNCGQLLLMPTLLSGERLTFNGCTFADAATFQNGVRLNPAGKVDMYFNACSFDNTQIALTAAGAFGNFIGCHYELVSGNPSVPMVSQIDGELLIAGGSMIIGSSGTSMPEAIRVTNTTARASCYISGLKSDSSIAMPFLSIGSAIDVKADAFLSGSYTSPYVTGNTTGAYDVKVIAPAGNVKTVSASNGVADGSVALVSGTAPAIDVSQGNYFTLSILTDIAVVIAIPTGVPFQGGQEITICMRNASGGALTNTPTFNTGAGGFKFSAASKPSNGTQILYKFRWDSVQSFWYEIGTHQTSGL